MLFLSSSSSSELISQTVAVRRTHTHCPHANATRLRKRDSASSRSRCRTLARKERDENEPNAMHSQPTERDSTRLLLQEERSRKTTKERADVFVLHIALQRVLPALCFCTFCTKRFALAGNNHDNRCQRMVGCDEQHVRRRTFGIDAVGRRAEYSSRSFAAAVHATAPPPPATPPEIGATHELRLAAAWPGELDHSMAAPQSTRRYIAFNN